jgi:outer membrane immunogenic protein
MTIRTGSAAAFAALMAATLPAAAADIGPARAVSAPAAPSVAAIPLWSGFYAGVHLGGVVRDWDADLGFLAVDCSTCSRGETRSASFGGLGGSEGAAAGGIQAGYNWQSGSIVFGFEVDGALVGSGETRTYAVGSAALIAAGLGAITTPLDGFSGRFASEIDWMATARGRIGFAVGSLLIYGTAGLAAADIETSASYLGLTGVPSRVEPVSATDGSVELGWTVGAGVEAALTSNLSAKLEYLYADFGAATRPLGLYIDDPTSLQQFVSLKEDIALHSFRVGLNYRFP